MIWRDRKASVEIISVVFAIFAIIIALAVAMVFLLFGQGKDMSDIKQFNYISEGNIHVENIMQIMFNSETGGETIRDKIRNEPFADETETAIEEVMDEFSKLIIETQYQSSVDLGIMLLGDGAVANLIEEAAEGAVEELQNVANKVSNFLWGEDVTKTVDTSKANEIIITIDGLKISTQITAFTSTTTEGLYQIKIKKGAQEEVIGSIEGDSSNLYTETEELVSSDSEKVTITLIVKKDKVTKQTLYDSMSAADLSNLQGIQVGVN